MTWRITCFCGHTFDCTPPALCPCCGELVMDPADRMVLEQEPSGLQAMRIIRAPRADWMGRWDVEALDDRFGWVWVHRYWTRRAALREAREYPRRFHALGGRVSASCASLVP